MSFFRDGRRNRCQNAHVKKSVMITAAAAGTRMERTETVVEVASSAKLTGMWPAPPVAAVTAGRIVVDLTA